MDGWCALWIGWFALWIGWFAVPVVESCMLIELVLSEVGVVRRCADLGTGCTC